MLFNQLIRWPGRPLTHDLRHALVTWYSMVIVHFAGHVLWPGDAINKTE